MTEDKPVQVAGNYNVFCQSCGKVVASNVETNQEALNLEKDHLQQNKCQYTGTHKIKESVK